MNQFAIDLGFYMLMPYLAAHLTSDLHLAAWAVGLVLGVRNLSQQGMFLIGGTLATGTLWDYATRNHAARLPWTVLTTTGLACAAAVLTLAHTGRLTTPAPQPAPLLRS